MSGSWAEAGSLAPPEPDTGLERLEARIGHRFGNRALLEQALTHPSRAYEQGDLSRSNERLEFLGDAVLELMVSEILMARYPDAPEGSLTRARADAVNRGALAGQARALALGSLLRLGKGEEAANGREKPSILANAFEALIGALYLDGGAPAARALVEREIGPALHGARLDVRDPKSRLNETLQALGRPLPSYEVTCERGPSHERVFEIEVRVVERVLGRGTGRSKRDAEQQAAQHALEALEAEALEPPSS
jgi:ribonuclease-3